MESIDVVCPEGDPVISVLSATTDVRVRPHSPSTIHESAGPVVATEDDCRHGLALLKTIRKHDASRPVILLTECYDSQIASEAIDAGVTDYLALSALEEPRATLYDRLDSVTTDSGFSLGAAAFRTLADSVGDAILAVDTASRIVFANEGIEELTGYAPTELRGRSLLSLIPEEMHDAHKRGVARYLETGERELDWESIELPLAHRAGHEITVAVSFGEFRSDGEQYFTGAIRDITTQNQQQAELRETREQLENTLSRISDAFFAVGTDWRFTYVNEHAEALLDRSAGELLGKNVWEEFPEAMTERFYDVYHRAMETQEAVTFEEHHAPLSTWFEVSAYPSEDGLSVYFRDVTERKAHEETLTDLIETNRALMRAETAEEIATSVVDATEGILGFDINGVHLTNDTDELEPTAVTAHTPELIGEPPTYARGEGIVGETFDASEARIYDDVRSADAFDYGSIRSAMVLPFDAHGVLVVGSLTPNAFDETDIRIAELLTASARTAFDRATRTRRIETLHEATREMIGAETTEQVCSRALAAAEAVLGHALTGIHLTDGEYLAPIVWTDGLDDLFESAPPKLGQDTLAWDAFETGEARLYDDLGTHSGRKNEATVFDSGLYVPIGDHGVLLVSSTERGAFDTTDLQLTRLLAGNMAVALDRVEREVELRRYETVLETVQEMVYVLDSAGECTMVTEPLANRLGYEREGMLGRKAGEILDLGAIKQGERIIKHLLSRPELRSETYETTARTTRGERFPVEVEISLLYSGDQFVGTVGVMRDISELKRTQKKLDDERDRFAYLFETLPDPVDEIAFKPDEPIVQSVNTAFERVFGSDSNSLVGSPLPNEAGDPRLDIEETRELSTETATGTRHFLFRRVPYSLDANTHAFGIYTDITEQKERERQLRVLHQVLRHNLRNGLNVVTAAANQLIAAECAADRRYLASTLVDRADDLVSLSEKASMLERTIERRDDSVSIDAVSVIESLVESYREDIDIETELPESCSVSADHRLTTVVSNLLNNVVEHASFDGSRPSARVTLETDDDVCELRIADDGPGIPELERELLSGTREITQLEHGSGLGLWLVKWTIESYGGTIEFACASGTTVVLRLPLTDD